MIRFVAALLVCVAVPASAAEARAVKLHIARTCFTATGPDGKPHTIYGKRFAAGTPSASTPAIVLVHGVASNAGIWDLTPRWSVARRLAHSGYVVIAYDRLGYRHSAYDGDPSGLTVSAQQSVIHDMVRQLHAGSYRVGRCGGTATRYASKRVALIGHSSGAFIVSSYPGRFHDVAAMVQADAPSGLSSDDPPGNAAVLSATAPPAHGAMDDQFGPVGDPSHDGPPPAVPAGYTTGGLSDRAACEEFDLWRAGAIRSVATAMCNPANVTPYPSAETNSYVAQAGMNQTLIPHTGKIPVLLAGADHDGIMPGDANALELSGWQEHCGCDVSQFIVKATGHAFMAHTSLVGWTRHVVAWLRKKGMAAVTPRGGVPGALPG